MSGGKYRCKKVGVQSVVNECKQQQTTTNNNKQQQTTTNNRDNRIQTKKLLIQKQFMGRPMR